MKKLLVMLGTAGLGIVPFVLHAQPSPVNTPAADDQQPRSLIHAKRLSIRELAEAADRIFIGRVERVETGPAILERDGKQATVETRNVTFRLEKVFKGNLQPGEMLTVRQYVPISAPVKEGEILLWYLSKDSTTGLTQPLGIFSGHFRVVPDVTDPKGTSQVAVNLVNNEGLWGSKRQLWVEGTALDRKAIVGTALAEGVPPDRVAKLKAVGSAPNRPGPVPLELIVSATKNIVGASDSGASKPE